MDYIVLMGLGQLYPLIRLLSKPIREAMVLVYECSKLSSVYIEVIAEAKSGLEKSIIIGFMMDRGMNLMPL